MAGGMYKGAIAEYDEKTLTATVVASDGSGTYRNASVPLAKLDYGAGSYDLKPPSPGSPCIFTLVEGEAYIMSYYLPVNLGSSEDNTPLPCLDLDAVKDQTPELERTTDNLYTRAPSDFPTKSTLPGDSVVRGASGSEIGFMDNVYRIIISPTLSFIMNHINNVIDVVATIFHFKSPGVEIHSKLNEMNDCDIQVIVNDNAEKTGKVSSVDLNIGKQAGLINLKINGEPFLKVDNERNVILQGKTIIMEFDMIEASHSGRCRLP